LRLNIVVPQTKHGYQSPQFKHVSFPKLHRVIPVKIRFLRVPFGNLRKRMLFLFVTHTESPEEIPIG